MTKYADQYIKIRRMGGDLYELFGAFKSLCLQADQEIANLIFDQTAFLLELQELFDQHPDDMNDSEMVEEARALIYRRREKI